MFGRGSGTITVIEEPVIRSAKRNAKIVFWVTWVITGLLAATVAASRYHPILALVTGVAFGLVVAFPLAILVAIWPVLRAIWWWIPETITGGSLIYGWTELASHTNLLWRIISVAVITGVPAAVRPVRARINAVLWCLAVRHRLRTCFSEFIITNRTGSLPLILWAAPTPVGERVWIWLRPGLAMDNIMDQLDKIAVACWAANATAEVASTSNAAFIRMDLKRRDALTGTITSPLLQLIRKDTPAAQRDAIEVPTALDLPQVSPSEVIPAKPVRIPRPDTRTPAPASSPAPAPASDDITDWL
jgi:hypothetical protein